MFAYVLLFGFSLSLLIFNSFCAIAFFSLRTKDGKCSMEVLAGGLLLQRLSVE